MKKSLNLEIAIDSKSKKLPNILVVARTFLPEEGEIQEYAYSRCLQDCSRVIVWSTSCWADRKFDLAQPFPIHRWPEPQFIRRGKPYGILSKLSVYLSPCDSPSSFIGTISINRLNRCTDMTWQRVSPSLISFTPAHIPFVISYPITPPYELPYPITPTH